MIRKTSRNVAQAAALVALLALFSGCDQVVHQAVQARRSVQADEPLHEETRTTNVPHQSNAALAVKAVNGSVVVNQTDRDDVQIVAHLKAVSPERLEAAIVVADRDESGRLSISVEWPEGKPRNREGCSFEVQIPDADDVTIRTSNGKAQLSGLGGKADVETSNGAVNVKGHNGPLHARTSNGEIAAIGVHGTIDASTNNGKVEIAEATDRVDAKTSNGAIVISLASDGPGPIDARTSNGPINLNLSRAMQGRLTLKTSNGAINVDSSCESQVVSAQKNRAVLDFGSSENQSSAETSNGAIEVKRLQEIAP